MTAADRMFEALNKLCKWRTVFTGWQLGTRSNEDPESQAVRDHRETTMIQRVELTALMSLMIRKGMITQDEYFEAVAEEADLLDADYESRFRGFKTTQAGVTVDSVIAADTMRFWRK